MRVTQEIATQRGDIPYRFAFQSSCRVSNLFYVFGGTRELSSGQYQFTNDFFSFDPAIGVWTSIPSSSLSPSPRALAGMTSVGSHIFVFGGYDMHQGNYRCFNGLFRFDTTTGAWESISTRGDVPSPRAGCGMTSYDGRLYIFGGSQGSDVFFNDLFELDTSTMVWRRLASIDTFTPSVRCGCSLNAVNGSLYVFGGWTFDEERQFALDDLRVFSIEKEVWISPKETKTRGASPSSRTGHASAVLGSRIFIACGALEENHPRKSVHVLDTVKMKWKFVANVPHCLGCCMEFHPHFPHLFLFGGAGFRKLVPVVSDGIQASKSVDQMFMLLIDGLENQTAAEFEMLQSTPPKLANHSLSSSSTDSPVDNVVATRVSSSLAVAMSEEVFASLTPSHILEPLTVQPFSVRSPAHNASNVGIENASTSSSSATARSLDVSAALSDVDEIVTTMSSDMPVSPLRVKQREESMDENESADPFSFEVADMDDPFGFEPVESKSSKEKNSSSQENKSKMMDFWSSPKAKIPLADASNALPSPDTKQRLRADIFNGFVSP